MRPATALRACEQQLASAAQLRARGVSDAALHRALAAGEVHRVRRAVYAPAPLPPLPRHVVTAEGVAPAYVAHVRAALLSLGGRASAQGRTAAALRGWGLLVEPSRTVDVAVDHGRSRVPAPGVRAEQRRGPRRELLTALPGTVPLWTTSAAQTAVDCVARLPMLEAVVVCDSALRAGDLTVEDLVREADRARGRAAAKLGRVLQLVDGRAESVLESVQRVRMTLAGLTGFEPQVLVRDVPALRVDFCFRLAGVLVEVDGARWHPDPARDQARDNALAALGWRVLRYTWADVVHDAERVLAEVRAAVESGGPSFRLGQVTVPVAA